MKNVTLNFNHENPEMIPSRDGYGHGLVNAGKANENVVAIGADITASTRADWFRDTFPNRFFNMGIAEQNQMGVAAGLSLAGKIPFVCNYGVFLCGRAWDQIRTTVCYANLNVKLAGAHGGISVGPDGATHQALEEISVMRCLPNMTVIVPADAPEAEKATVAMAEMTGPAYVRFGREKVPVITNDETPFEIGKAYCCREGKDAAVIACGAMVYESLIAADILSKQGIELMVINCHTIKPIDKDAILEAAARTGKIITVEEHQIMGGMGSAVLEVLEETPVPSLRLGIRDRFGESGSPDDLKKAFRLDAVSIAEDILDFLNRHP